MLPHTATEYADGDLDSIDISILRYAVKTVGIQASMIAKIYFLLNLFVFVAALIQGPQAWKRRRRPVAKPLVLWCIFLVLISLTHIINFLVDYQLNALLIENITICLGFFVQIIWIWSLTEFTLDRTVNKFSLLLIESILMTIVIITNDSHQLFYDAANITMINGLPNVVMSFGPLRNLHALFITVLWNGFIVWAIYQHSQKPRVPSRVFFTLIFLVIVSQVQLWLYAMGFTPFKFSVVINACIMLAATYYYRVLDIIPFARKKIVENMNAGIATINKDNEIVDRNAQFENMVSMSIPLTEPFQKVSNLPEGFKRILENEDTIQSDGVIEGADEKQLAYDLFIIEGKNKDKGKSLVLRDVTEETNLSKQKEYYTQQLENSKTELERLDQMKSNFFSNITHEFRTPLTLIQEPARILMQHSEEQVRTNARLIANNSKKLLGLVNQLLTLTRMDSGKVEINLVLGDITDVLREEFQKFLPKAQREGLLLKLNIEDDFPMIFFDKEKIESIISNLMSNALKYTDDGVIEVSLGRIKGQPDEYFIEVKDSGRGIPEPALDYIFERFYQVDGTDTRKGEGTGIGLALTHQIVQLLEGKITVESKLDKGSTFKVILPISTIEDTTVANARHEAPVSSEPEAPVSSQQIALAPVPSKVTSAASGDEDLLGQDTTHEKIALVVEDNAELRQFIKTGLSSNYKVVSAANGEEGIKKALSIVPDIVISDIMMPEKDGITMLQELKSDVLTAHIPIILLTAKSDIEDRLTGLSFGADQYLTKPFRMDELIIRSNNLISNRIRATQKYIEAYQTQTSIEPSFNDPKYEFVKKLIVIIEAELSNESMQIDDFAERLFISRTQLHRKIKSLTDQSTSEFIRNYRLDKAMIMLKQNEGNISEIAARVGFGNEKYFSTSFKKKFGLSPSQV